MQAKHANDRKRLNRVSLIGYAVDFACSIAKPDLFHLLLSRFSPPDNIALGIPASHRSLTAWSSCLKPRSHSIPIAHVLQRGDGIRIALDFSESNCQEDGSQSIEEKGAFVQTTNSAISAINQEEAQ